MLGLLSLDDLAESPLALCLWVERRRRRRRSGWCRLCLWSYDGLRQGRGRVWLEVVGEEASREWAGQTGSKSWTRDRIVCCGEEIERAEHAAEL